MIFNAFTGERNLAFTYSESGHGEKFARLLLLNSGQNPDYGFIMVSRGADVSVVPQYYALFKFAAKSSTFTSNAAWALLKSTAGADSRGLGLIFGES